MRKMFGIPFIAVLLSGCVSWPGPESLTIERPPANESLVVVWRVPQVAGSAGPLGFMDIGSGAVFDAVYSMESRNMVHWRVSSSRLTLSRFIYGLNGVIEIWGDDDEDRSLMGDEDIMVSDLFENGSTIVNAQDYLCHNNWYKEMSYAPGLEFNGTIYKPLHFICGYESTYTGLGDDPPYNARPIGILRNGEAVVYRRPPGNLAIFRGNYGSQPKEIASFEVEGGRCYLASAKANGPPATIVELEDCEYSAP